MGEELKQALIDGRIDLRAANTLTWLSPAEQRAVAHWLDEHPKRHIGPITARKLVREKGKGRRIGSKTVEELLRPSEGRARPHWVQVPTSKLPKGLTRDEAEQWLDRAIEAYKQQGKHPD
ncbi:hypothetical protein CRD59_07045 [Bifidobacterium xylocopae]|uniref:Uncharacterized protein n=1 Tax=Bifidobacterium xylocopae TaxID=2493119 RepID=A0A366KDU6_9BIFI|nr:hypothetical protein CRD59_07045 [Bifidobacterium xylocopae]